MQREDYMLRMIAQMGRVLAAIRRMLIEGKTAEAGGELESAAQKGGIDLALLIALDEPSLEPWLRTGGEIDLPKCAFFAEVVYLEWQRQLAMKQSERAERCARRTLMLFALAYDRVVIDEDTRQRIAELEAYLGGDDENESEEAD
jgi:hypothetical protein